MGQQQRIQSSRLTQIETESSVSLASVQGVKHHQPIMCKPPGHGYRPRRIRIGNQREQVPPFFGTRIPIKKKKKNIISCDMILLVSYITHINLYNIYTHLMTYG